MRKRTSFSFVLLFVLLNCSAYCQSLDGNSALRIVRNHDAAPPIQFAVAELVKYVRLMGNRQPTVLEAPHAGDIYVGMIPYDVPSEQRRRIETSVGGNPDSFVIRTLGDALVIYGGSPRANLYGVYHYLETLGVRWYFPGAGNEFGPQAPARLQRYNITQSPSFRKRGIVVFSTTPGFNDLVDFAAKMKLNTIGLHAIPFGPQSADVGLADAQRAAEPRGLTVDIERHLFGESYCPDDLLALDREKKTLIDYVSTLPPAMTDFFLWPADKFLSPCNSPAFRDYSVSDLVMSFANQMVAALRKTRPEARFAFLSYLSTWEPPKHVKPAPGLILEWAPMFQSFAQSMDDPLSVTNTEYRGNFEALLKLFGPENSQVLGYWLDDTLFSRTYYGRLPYLPEVLKGDLAYYHRRGVPAVTTFGVITGRDYFLSHASPAVFLYPRLLWDVKSDPREIMRDFCRNYFGSDETLEIYDSLAEADRLVYVERHRLRADGLSDPRFVAATARALKLSGDMLRAQTDPERRARFARLMQEVSARFADPKMLAPKD
jgi:hypothetical protein